MHIKRYSLWHFDEQWNYGVTTIRREIKKQKQLALYLIAVAAINNRVENICISLILSSVIYYEILNLFDDYTFT